MRAMTLLAAAAVLAACAKPAPEAPAVVAVDSAGARSAFDAIRATFEKSDSAGDAAAIAGLFREDGGIDFQGAPPMRNRAGIEAGLKAGYAIQKPEKLEIVTKQTLVRTNSDGAETGDYHSIYAMGGKRTHQYGRWVASYVKDSTSWKISYLMSLTDSIRTEK